MAADLQNKPVVNRAPGEENSLSATLDAVLGMHGMKTDRLIPAQVIDFDRVNNVAVVQPMIMLWDVSDNTRPRKSIASIPVLSLGGGGFHISFPLKQGDLGWILAADRDIGLFMQGLSMSRPNTLRKHTFSSGWFIPDVFRKYTLNGADSANMVLQTTDGSTRISIGEGTVTITAPTLVKIDTQTAQFTHDVDITGNLTVTGQTVVNGGLDASGSSAAEVTLPTNTTIGGIVVYGHGHNGVQSGPNRTTGGMVA
jgi:hypothetical protein